MFRIVIDSITEEIVTEFQNTLTIIMRFMQIISENAEGNNKIT